jgi:hypothetical protein
LRFAPILGHQIALLPKPAGFGVDVTAGEIGWTIVGAVAAATAAHGIGHAVRSHMFPIKETEAEKTPEKVTEEK